MRYEGQLLEQATSSLSLATRLKLNAEYSSTDFNQWFWSKVHVKQGDNVLDVGCGNGAQSLTFAKKIGREGTVSAIDISEGSVKTLNRKAQENHLDNIQTVTGDMIDLDRFIERDFCTKIYDISHSTYSIYYASDRVKVMDTMRHSLKKEGSLIIFTPYKPHGMVEFIKQFTQIPSQVEECFEFGPNVLEPYFRDHFWDVEIHFFHNIVKFPSADIFMEFYRSTTYYNEQIEEQVTQSVQAEINKQGYFQFKKNGYLIIGKNQF